MHAFKYHRPSSVDAAAALMKGEAKLLAGGQSLVQTMKLRLASPSDIVDLGTIKVWSASSPMARPSRSAR